MIKKETQTIYIGVRFPAHIAQWLRARAREERRSVSSLIVLLLERDVVGRLARPGDHALL